MRGEGVMAGAAPTWCLTARSKAFDLKYSFTKDTLTRLQHATSDTAPYKAAPHHDHALPGWAIPGLRPNTLPRTKGLYQGFAAAWSAAVYVDVMHSTEDIKHCITMRSLTCWSVDAPALLVRHLDLGSSALRACR